MAEETAALSPRKTAAVLALVAGCCAVLWPQLLRPALLGPAHDALRPNQHDRAAGCCDVIFETDVNAIKIMTELCGNILERKSGPLDPRTATAFASGKLPLDIIAMCRVEVNATCGVDISSFLQQNVKLGKSYKQILDEVRSYNSSACLKMHFGVPTWELGTHVIARPWTNQEELTNAIKQERPSHHRGSAPHPAMRERGRAIPPGAPTPPSRGPATVVPMRDPPRTVAGRVGKSPLSVYYQEQQEPPPIPGVRPPLGGAGGVLPPPKSSVGFVMPIYTICIVVFFIYTLCKILFKRTGGPSTTYEPVISDPNFRQHVFEDGRSSRSSPETKLVVTAISGLVAEVQQQMEASYAQSRRANSAQDSQDDITRPYTNGTLRSARDASPVLTIPEELREVAPEPETPWNHRQNTPTPEPKDRTPELKERSPEEKEWSPDPKDTTLGMNYENVDEKQSTPELLAEALKEESPHKDEATYEDNEKGGGGADKEGEIEGLSEEEIEYEDEDEEEEEVESPVMRQLRASVETDKASVKVLGMEMTAHCEGGAAWGDRPVSPTALPRPPAQPQRPPHEAAEVSSIYLEGDIPQQSRLLVADSAIRTDHGNEGKNSPVVLSGKMTLSLINDIGKESPERDLDSTANDDDDFTTASAVTQPKLNTQQEEELSEEEVEEEVEEEEDEIEVEEIELEDDEENEAQPAGRLLEHASTPSPLPEYTSTADLLLEAASSIESPPEQISTTTFLPPPVYSSEADPPLEQTSDAEESPEQTSDIEESPEQTSDTEESPEHSDTEALLEHITTTPSLPELTSSTPPLLDHKVVNKVLQEHSSVPEEFSEHTSYAEISPEHARDTEELPEHTSDAEISPDHASDTEELPEQTSDAKISPDHASDTEELPEQTNYAKISPDHAGDTEELPEHTSDAETSPEHSNGIKASPERTTPTPLEDTNTAEPLLEQKKTSKASLEHSKDTETSQENTPLPEHNISVTPPTPEHTTTTEPQLASVGPTTSPPMPSQDDA